MKNLSEEEKKQLINEYVNTPISLTKLCIKYKIRINDFFILKGKEKFSRVKHPYKPKKVKKGRNSCDLNFFKYFTDISCYWLGFLISKADVYTRSIKIGMPLFDLDHLEKFKRDIQSTYEISTTKLSCEIVIKINSLLETLEALGLSKESRKFSEDIPEEMMSHFLRGLFDGKGSFDICYNNPLFSVSLPSEEFCEKYQEILMKNCNLAKGKIQADEYSSYYSLIYTGKEQVKRIMDYLYKDATIYLDRKYQKFQQHYANL